WTVSDIQPSLSADACSAHGDCVRYLTCWWRRRLLHADALVRWSCPLLSCRTQYDLGRPRFYCATKLRTISRLTGAIRESREPASICTRPYSSARPLPPNV